MTTIAVIGGTGYAGASIAREAAARGHQVAALSRHTPADPIAGVSYTQGQASDAAEVISGADVVVGALSPRAGSEGTLLESYTTVANQAAAIGARFIVIGGFGSLRPAPGEPRFADTDGLPPEILPEARELNAVRESLAAGAPENLDWLFVSPGAEYGGHAEGPDSRGTYRTSDDVALFDGNGTSTISGEDFALAVVNEIDNPAHHRAHIHFAY